jgi:hypothetical protein
LREKVGIGFSWEQCSQLLESITFFAFGHFRPKATRSRALREKVGTDFSWEQCSQLLESITFFAFGRFRPKATRSRALREKVGTGFRNKPMQNQSPPASGRTGSS